MWGDSPSPGTLGTEVQAVTRQDVSYVHGELEAFASISLSGFSETGFLCVALPGCPGTCSIDQAGFELRGSALLSASEYWD